MLQVDETAAHHTAQHILRPFFGMKFLYNYGLSPAIPTYYIFTSTKWIYPPPSGLSRRNTIFSFLKSWTRSRRWGVSLLQQTFLLSLGWQISFVYTAPDAVQRWEQKMRKTWSLMREKKKKKKITLQFLSVRVSFPVNTKDIQRTICVQ